MIRRLIILLLIVGCVFAQTEDNSSLDKILLINEPIFEGEYISMDDDNIIFKPKGSIAGQSIDKTKVKLVTLADGTVIYRKASNIEKQLNSTWKEGYIGGIFIAIGGVILISQNEKDLEDIDDYEQFKTTNTIAYALITIGGILVALGI